jgi:hypothetical protein
MASLTAGTTFTDGVANDVTAAKLGALVTNATPTSGFIQDRTAETVVAVNDTLLIGDASDSNNLKRMTVANFLKAPLVSTSGTIDVLTTGTTTSTAEIVTSGTIATLNSTTGTIATLNSTTGTIATLNSTTGTIATLNSTTGTIATLNSTTGTITNLSATTSTFLGTITGSTNVINIGSGQIYKDASGNVVIGNTSPRSKLDVNGNIYVAGGNQIQITGSPGTTGLQLFGQDAAESLIGTMSSQALVFRTYATERLRIDSSGNVLVGTSDSSLTTGVGFKLQASSTIPRMGIVINSTTDSNYHLYNTNATYNGYRFYVSTNGGIANFSANNSNLSDARLKTDIQNAGNYLEKICSIPVKTFLYKDQGDDTEKTIGVIAQEVESQIPELVNNDGFGETPEDGIPLKSIYQTDLQYALMRCIQELKAENDSLKSRVAALEAA